MEKLSTKPFIKKIHDFYAKNRRDFPWRYAENPYFIVVSEIMLQQTQTFRVEPKYNLFINRFHSFEALANATQKDIFAYWQGLGYNRRAMYLQKVCQWVITNHNGELPKNPVLLETQKGIGYATARSICTFAFNIPTAFIETNIRSVFLHEFFNGQTNVKDNQIMPLVEQTVDKKDPRSWYYALMDYGVFLKATIPNPSKQSAHQNKQSKFEGSTRQIRGAIIRLLLEQQYNHDDLLHIITTQYPHATSSKTKVILQKMIIEKMIKYSNDQYGI
ncbi:A/G-specific adenine glycosylase [Candidatus Dependentiae bacterium]|nr:MAG: A/G-specific adenine glycosylase [Candidatus Dependentiae bacterium]